MRRIFSVVTVGAIAAAMMVLSGGTAFAGSVTECTKNPNPKTGPATVTCVTTTVTQETEFVERTVTEFVQRTVTVDVVTTATEFVERPTTGPCQVGRSDRVGVAEGIATDEVLVTTTETFNVVLQDEFLVTLKDEILVTTTTVTTQVFKGGEPNPKQLLSTVTGTPVETRVLQATTEISRVLQATTELSRTLVDTDVQREVVDTTFTATGKCKNIPGPQSRAS
jgi:hypothetical protein